MPDTELAYSFSTAAAFLADLDNRAGNCEHKEAVLVLSAEAERLLRTPEEDTRRHLTGVE